MQGHLRDDEVAGLLAGEEDERASAHLASCESCRAENERLVRGLSGLRDELRRGGGQAPAWRVPEPRRAALSHRLGWAAAAAVAALAVAIPAARAPEPAPSPVPVTTPAAGLSDQHDQELLMGVEQALRREVPSALAPAALLMADLDGAVQHAESRRARP